MAPLHALLLACGACCSLPLGADGRRLMSKVQPSLQAQANSSSAATSADLVDEALKLPILRGDSPGAAAAGYNESEARVYANFALATYCQNCAKLSWSCGPACRAAHIQDRSIRLLGPGRQHQLRGFVAELPDRGPRNQVQCVAAFRGSANVWNWIANAQFVWAPWMQDQGCPSCQVHAGFAAAYAELEEEFFKALSALRCQRVGVTGHSLGGATAALAAFRVRTAYQIVAEPVYIFHSPRVGNDAWVRSFVRSAGSTVPAAWRIVQYKDPVPRVPQHVLGYRHFPREVYYQENGAEFQICSASNGEDRACSYPFYLNQCMFHVSMHSIVVGTDYDAAGDECTRASRDRRCTDLRRCTCDVVRTRGRHTNFTNPMRMTWETSSDHPEACEREIWEQMSVADQLIFQAHNCTNVNPVVTCSCDVRFWFRSSETFFWQTVSSSPRACEHELLEDMISLSDILSGRVRSSTCKASVAAKSVSAREMESVEEDN